MNVPIKSMKDVNISCARTLKSLINKLHQKRRTNDPYESSVHATITDNKHS